MLKGLIFKNKKFYASFLELLCQHLDKLVTITEEKDRQLILSMILTCIYIPASRETVIPLFLNNIIAVLSAMDLLNLLKYLQGVTLDTSRANSIT